jgi:hypothetical protein
MIQQLTEPSWSILAAFARQERDSLLTYEKAQASAVSFFLEYPR